MGKFAQILAAVLFCTISAGPAAAQGAIEVVGLDGRKVSIALAGLERRTVIVEDRGLKTTFEGVALADVLAKTGVELGDRLRGTDALSRVVIASARDGYQVAYSIAEVDPGFSNQVVLVADQRDGKPLLPDTGPLQIVVPNDKRAARWMRQLTSIEVRQLSRSRSDN
jgi:DMSO/TMAO reductase YedYZ molybdopterin-dependent catalytic subunit